MAKYWTIACYSACIEQSVTFPEDKTWGDVEAWFVKWGMFHVKFKNVPDWLELEMSESSDLLESVDFKRPSSVTIHPADANGWVDFDEELAEQGD